MKFTKEFLEMVSDDIYKLGCVLGDEKLDYLLELHREIDGKYQACIKDWYKGVWGTDNTATNIWYGSISDSRKQLFENLQSFKAKLETFKFQMNVNEVVDVPSTQVNVTTNVNVSVTFEQVRSQVENMTSLTDEQTQEVLDKINDIETICEENGSKKSKWEKVKPVLVWLADKSFDVGMTMLPLLLKMGE